MDDLVRERIAALPYEKAMQAAGDANWPPVAENKDEIEFDDIPRSASRRGVTPQRLLYNFFLKCTRMIDELFARERLVQEVGELKLATDSAMRGSRRAVITRIGMCVPEERAIAAAWIGIVVRAMSTRAVMRTELQRPCQAHFLRRGARTTLAVISRHDDASAHQRRSAGGQSGPAVVR